jgi:hypothetical protein
MAHIQPTIALLTLSIALSLTGATQAAPTITEQDVAAHRAQGQAGLSAFLATYGQDLAIGSAQKPETTVAARAALDQLCQQRDCHASQLYWYTDLEKAKTAAQASGKPILSLRLLGKLNEDLSCANSRFFRVALYPNAAVSKVLREQFILHWQSVRPVPTVTIDFGDGRKLVRTVTGNSIHYVLDPSGRPLEAIPGLYGPQAFLQQLQRAEQLARDYSQRSREEQAALLQQYHRDRLMAIQTAWVADLNRLGVKPLPTLVELPPALSQPPTAGDAGQLAITKMMVEFPVLRSFGLLASQNQQALANATNLSLWNRISGLHRHTARLDENSLALIRAKRDVNASE